MTHQPEATRHYTTHRSYIEDCSGDSSECNKTHFHVPSTQMLYVYLGVYVKNIRQLCIPLIKLTYSVLTQYYNTQLLKKKTCFTARATMRTFFFSVQTIVLTMLANNR
jgi:hypothetical protein